MCLILFSSRQYDIDTSTEANAAHGFELHFQASPLDSGTAILAHDLGMRVLAFDPGTPRNVVHAAR